MEWTFLDTWIVVTAMLSAMSCALPGAYLVLRRMSMMGDAISHAVLPGLAVAFILTGSRESLPMLAGATVVGLLTTFLVQAVVKLSGLDKGASMGVIFTTLFALGLILIRRAADHVDLDPGCVLYGAIELTPLDVTTLLGMEIPQAAVTNAAVLAVNLVFVLLFYKELKITAFDPALATTMGINAGVMHYALMTLVAVTTIAAFESVGSILVIAMLIIPGATAHLLTDRLSVLLVLSLVIAALCAVSGHIAAITVPVWFGFRDTSTAGMMATVAGLIFLAVFFLAPRYGLLGRILRRGMLSLGIVREDVMGLLYRYREVAPRDAAPLGLRELKEALKQGAAVRMAVWDLLRTRRIRRHTSGFTLTDKGLGESAGIIRSHRLWESYLCERMGYCMTSVHASAHRLEHVTDPEMQAALHRAAGRPTRDPHDRKIPD